MLRRRLIWFVNNRISNGDISERGLARILRISQPQIHNVLKGARKLTPELADRFLRCFGMTVIDLLHTSDVRERFTSMVESEVDGLRMQEAIGAHIEVQRFRSSSEPVRKRAARESLSDSSRSSKTA